MLSRFAALALASILAFSQPVDVSIVDEHGVLFVSASINGIGPLLFIFDPGAGDFITTYGAERIGGKPALELALGDASVRGQFPVLSGDPEQLDPHHDPANGAIAGSLGPAFLQRYAVRIDYAKSTIALIPFNAVPPLRETDALPLRIDSYGVPTVIAVFDGIAGRFEIDVRAPVSMLFSPFVRQHHIVEDGAHRMTVGRFTVRNVAVRLSGATAGKFASTEVAGLIGNDVLSKFVVTLDYKRRAVYLER